MSRKGSRRARQGRPKRWQDGLRFGVVAATTPGVSRESFGHPLVLSKAVGHWAERVRRYETAEDVARDFPPTSGEYAAAAAYFAGSDQPWAISVGRSPGPRIGSIVVSTTPLIGKLAVEADGRTHEYDATGQTIEQAAEGISALLNADPSAATGERLDDLAALTGAER